MIKNNTMKITTISYAVLALLLLSILAACNKGDDNFLYKGDMLPVTLSGYNGSGEEMEITLDTFRFGAPIGSGTFSLTEAYIFPENKNTVTLRVHETSTGKLVLEKELKKEDGEAKIRFMYMNDKISDMPEMPAVEEGKIKISYMFKPTATNYSGPVDIVLGKYYFIPKVFEEIATIKNANPYEFTSLVTIPTFSTVGQQYNGQNTPVLFVVYLYKAGTKELYTTGTEYTWHATSSTAPKPPSSVASSKLYIFSEAPEGNTMRFRKDLEL